jgi:uncharacterized membrane protein YfcA
MADIALVLCILVSAYFIRRLTGFGSALIAVPLLALDYPFTFAVPLGFVAAESRDYGNYRSFNTTTHIK